MSKAKQKQKQVLSLLKPSGAHTSELLGRCIITLLGRDHQPSGAPGRVPLPWYWVPFSLNRNRTPVRHKQETCTQISLWPCWGGGREAPLPNPKEATPRHCHATGAASVALTAKFHPLSSRVRVEGVVPEWALSIPFGLRGSGWGWGKKF